MDILMYYLYTYLVCGILLGGIGSVALVMISRRMWPIFDVVFEDRFGAKLVSFYKCRQVKKKDGNTAFLRKRPVLIYGFPAILQRPTETPPPMMNTAVKIKDGGDLLISHANQGGLINPVDIEFSEDEKSIKLISRFEILKTWYKIYIKDLVRNQLLKPKTKLETLLPLALCGMFIIGMIILYLMMVAVPTQMSAINSQFSAWMANMEQFTGQVGAGVGQAASNVQVATPIK